MHSHTPRARFVLPVRVYYEDTDAAGVVYYANYLRYLERARSEWLRALGFEQQHLARDAGIGFAVRAVSVDYIKPARLDDALEVVSSIEHLGRAQVTFAQRVERGGERLVTGHVRVACLYLAAMKPTPIPEPLHRKFETLL